MRLAFFPKGGMFSSPARQREKNLIERMAHKCDLVHEVFPKDVNGIHPELWIMVIDYLIKDGLFSL